jgi:hypothetical protein
LSRRPFPARNRILRTRFSKPILFRLTYAADISPDDSFVVIDVVERSTEKSGNVVDTNRVEVRDFKANRSIATFTLDSVEVLRSSNTKRIIGGVPSASVRYSPDGQSILAWFRSTLYVLQSTNLKIVSKFALQAPSSWPVRLGYQTKPYLSAMEISSDNLQFVTMWTCGLQRAVSTYAVKTGTPSTSWPIPDGSTPNDFLLSPDGQSVTFSVGNAFCSPRPTLNGVYKLNVATGAIEPIVKTEMLPSIPAFLPRSSLAFSIKLFCSREKPRAELAVYDTSSNAFLYRKQTPYATGWVLSSPESRRMVTYSGDWKRVFDWGDFTGWYYTPGRQTFTVWDSQTLQPVARSQNLPGLSRNTVRMSRSGRYIVTSGWHMQKSAGHAVYELP